MENEHVAIAAMGQILNTTILVLWKMSDNCELMTNNTSILRNLHSNFPKWGSATANWSQKHL